MTQQSVQDKEFSEAIVTMRRTIVAALLKKKGIPVSRRLISHLPIDRTIEQAYDIAELDYKRTIRYRFGSLKRKVVMKLSRLAHKRTG